MDDGEMGGAPAGAEDFVAPTVISGETDSGAGRQSEFQSLEQRARDERDIVSSVFDNFSPQQLEQVGNALQAFGEGFPIETNIKFWKRAVAMGFVGEAIIERVNRMNSLEGFVMTEKAEAGAGKIAESESAANDTATSKEEVGPGLDDEMRVTAELGEYANAREQVLHPPSKTVDFEGRQMTSSELSRAEVDMYFVWLGMNIDAVLNKVRRTRDVLLDPSTNSNPGEAGKLHRELQTTIESARLWSEEVDFMFSAIQTGNPTVFDSIGSQMTTELEKIAKMKKMSEQLKARAQSDPAQVA